MKKLRKCLARCLKAYRPDLSTTAIVIIVGCLVGAAVTGDFSGVALSLCLAVGGVSDVAGNLLVCLQRCMKDNGGDKSKARA